MSPAVNLSPPESDLNQASINAIRVLALDAIQKAPAGHPGATLEIAPMLYVLWSWFLKHNPSNPGWFDRDRFILSAAHGSALLYSLHYLTGYDLSLRPTEQSRRRRGEAESDPEGRFVLEDGVATGLGEGVGMAMVEAQLAARYNRPGFDIVDHFTYVVVGDRDLAGGVGLQAASLAGHLRLGKLVCLYDRHHVGAGPLSVKTFARDRLARFRASGWHTQVLADGHDVGAIEQAIRAARGERDRPSLILVSTRGVPGLVSHRDVLATLDTAGRAGVAGSDRERMGWCIPPEALSHWRRAVEAGARAERKWQERFAAYARAYPDLAYELGQAIRGELPALWDVDIPYFQGGVQLSSSPAPAKALPHSGEAGGLWGFRGHNLHFGSGEHAMRAILSGMASHGGAIPFGATFLIFAVYTGPVAWMQLMASAARL
jgi:transketolase